LIRETADRGIGLMDLGGESGGQPEK
jgi:hypothetical protein